MVVGIFIKFVKCEIPASFRGSRLPHWFDLFLVLYLVLFLFNIARTSSFRISKASIDC